VNNSRLRGSINELGQPFLLEVVIAAPNRDYLTGLVFPNLPALRERFGEAGHACPEDADFLKNEAVTGFFLNIFKQHNTAQKGSSGKAERLKVKP